MTKRKAGNGNGNGTDWGRNVSLTLVVVELFDLHSGKEAA
jgi:hypothetical protein